MREHDIRPQAIFDKYLRLAAEDVQTYFADVPRTAIDCPACGSTGASGFAKNGFEYRRCPDCRTLYVSPRPVAEAFTRYYTAAPSVEFWATTFYRATAEARREKLWKPKAESIRDLLNRYGAEHHQIVDIGGGYGIFAEEMEKLVGKAVLVIEPGPQLAAVCRERNLNVIEKFLEDVQEQDLPSGPKAFVSFELFEHLHDPTTFLTDLDHLMQSGDLFIFTTLSGTGVDILALWEDSKSISPPHHLNFFNPSSIRLLLSRLGLECLDVSTPGRLDIDILVNNREYIKDRFWAAFIDQTTESDRRQWQDMIAATGWSSHMRVCCRKPAST